MMSEKIINNIAYLIHQICAITGEKPGKTTLQRTVYLIQMEGVDLGYTYKPHCYGVFSEDLDSAINLLIADNIVHIEHKGRSQLMDIDSAYSTASDFGKETEDKIERTIEKYKEKSASESGLLTATHYVNQKLAGQDLPEIIRGVKKIVGTKCREEAINEAYMELLQGQ